MTTTATTRAAHFAATAADEAATALACFKAAADLPHHFENGATDNQRFDLTLQGIHAVNRSREAAAYAAGQAFSAAGNESTASYASAANAAYREALTAQDRIQQIDTTASRAWRKAQREANTDGSFAR